MPELLILRVTVRSPFEIVKLPLLARLQSAAERRFRRGAGRLVAKSTRALFNVVHRQFGVPATGRIAFAPGNGSRIALRFDGRNTHYAASFRDGTAGYEPETLALLDALVPRDGVFFDVGANWGYFALAIAGRRGFAGTVYAFEPAAAVREELVRLASQAVLSNRIICRAEALSDRSGSSQLVSGGRHTALARLAHEGQGESVTLARLDGLGLPAPDVMKIDVEGHEEHVLAGATKTITQHRPMIVLESWYRPAAAETSIAPLRRLGSWGYTLFRPLWQRDSASGPYLSPTAPSAGSIATLALLPFDPAERLAFGTDFNVFACPVDRLDVLYGIFQTEAAASSPLA